MIDDIENAPFFVYKEAPYATRWWNYGKCETYPGWDDEDDWYRPYNGYSADMGVICYCKSCGKPTPKSLSVRAKDNFGIFHNYCGDCAAKENNIGWCEMCGEPFVKNDSHDTLCVDCIDKTYRFNGGNKVNV